MRNAEANERLYSQAKLRDEQLFFSRGAVAGNLRGHEKFFSPVACEQAVSKRFSCSISLVVSEHIFLAD